MKTKFKLTTEDRNFLLEQIRSIIHTEPFLQLKKYRHHAHISTYTHVIRVAYLSYEFAKKHHLKVNETELIRAALFHDLYFYDWHDKNNGVHLHGLFHPKKAIRNAQIHYHLSKREARHMKHHMFPLTPIPPLTKEGWVICICDKKAARADYKTIRIRKKLSKEKESEFTKESLL